MVVLKQIQKKLHDKRYILISNELNNELNYILKLIIELYEL